MSTEENLALVRRFFEAQGEGDLDALDQILAEDFVDRSLLPNEDPDREGYKRSVAEDHAAFSELRYIIEDQVATDDKVVSRLTIRRVHDRGYFVGIAPTGEEYEATGIVIHRIAGGKVAEEWSEGSGILGLTQQRLEQEIREREHVEQELLVARRIQQASLPKEVPTPEGWEISPHYQPAREVGGDFYDFFELEGGQLALVVGDATGKGMPAALVMATTCGMLRAVAQSSNSPGEVLRRVNEALSVRIPPNMFVTCFYALLDPKTGVLSYANAGHDLPYLRRSNHAEQLRARGMPLGLMSGVSYEEGRNLLREGTASYSTAMDWWRPTTHTARCSALLDSSDSSRNMTKGDPWVRSSWRNSTSLQGRVGSRRMISPSLHYGPRRPVSVRRMSSGD